MSRCYMIKLLYARIVNYELQHANIVVTTGMPDVFPLMFVQVNKYLQIVQI